MADWYWLSPEDRDFLDEMKRRMRNHVQPPRYSEQPEQLYQTPEIYVARTPPEGIDALTRVVGDPPADYPGVAVCDIYTLIKDYEGQRAYLAPHPGNDLFQRPVYNLNLSRVGGNRWALVKRDKDGVWWADAPEPFPSQDDDVFATGTGTGVGSGGDPGGGVGDCDPIYIEETDLWCEQTSRLATVTDGGTDYDTGTNPVPSVLVSGFSPGVFLIDAGNLSTGTGTDLVAEGDLVVEDCGPWECTLTTLGAGLWQLAIDGAAIQGQWTARLSSRTATAASVTATLIGSEPSDAFLNLYRRRVYLEIDPVSGCLTKSADEWEFVRTVGCCDFECVTEPVQTGTGTGTTPSLSGCCDGRTLVEVIAYNLSGYMQDTGCFDLCTMSYNLSRPDPGALLWTNGTGDTNCDGNVLTLNLRVYCVQGAWYASGTIYRTFTPFDINFYIPLTDGGTTLTGTIPLGGGCGEASLVVDHPCPDEGTPGTIDTACCPDDLLPETLTVTVSGETGDCACLPATMTLTWDVVTTSWKRAGSGTCADPDLTLDCGFGTQWSLASTVCNFNRNPTSTSCAPFELVFNAPTITNCCTGSATFTVTE
jgi:hypothetical protein